MPHAMRSLLRPACALLIVVASSAIGCGTRDNPSVCQPPDDPCAAPLVCNEQTHVCEMPGEDAAVMDARPDTRPKDAAAPDVGADAPVDRAADMIGSDAADASPP